MSEKSRKTTSKKQNSERPKRSLTLSFIKKSPKFKNQKSRTYNLRIARATKIIFKINNTRTSTKDRSHYYYQIFFPLLFSNQEINVYLQELNVDKLEVPSLVQKNANIIFSSILIIAGLAGIFIFAGSDNNKLESVSSYSAPAPTNIESGNNIENSLPPSKPLRVKVSAADIDAPVMEVGQKKDKTMDVPPLFKNVTGWYKYSPTPGEIGPSIIVGHVDTYKGPSVFYKLQYLKKGDIISVFREDGRKIKFKVYGLQQFTKDNFPTEKVYGNTTDAELRLITCGGTFDHSTLEYSANTVVFAKAV